MGKKYNKLPLLGADYAERSSKVNAQRTVNLWPRITKPGSKSPLVLYPTPGHTKFCTSGDSPNRGNGEIFDVYGFFVAGSSLIQIDVNGTPLNKGTFDTSAGRVNLKAGRAYLLIVDGAKAWTWDGTTFAQVTDVDLPAAPTHSAYLHNYFIVNHGGTDEFFISALEDPTSWNSLDFDAASAVPDNVLALCANNKDLYVFGALSAQIYYYSGDPDFPFTLYTGGVLDLGIIAPHSLAEGSSGIFLLATTREGGIAVVQVNGFQSKIISDDIAWDLENMTTVDDAEALLYRKGGQAFYQISFPTENKTFEYIVESQMWVERKTFGINRYNVNGHVYLGAKNIVGTYDSGIYYKLDETTYDDDGALIERIRVTQPISMDGNPIKYSSVVLEIESGVGTASGAGATPVMAMVYSDDGGKTWSNEETASMGLIGEYGIILEWFKLGISRNRIFKFYTTDPVEVVIIDAYARVTVLT